MRLHSHFVLCNGLYHHGIQTISNSWKMDLLNGVIYNKLSTGWKSVRWVGGYLQAITLNLTSSNLCLEQWMEYAWIIIVVHVIQAVYTVAWQIKHSLTHQTSIMKYTSGTSANINLTTCNCMLYLCVQVWNSIPSLKNDSRWLLCLVFLLPAVLIMLVGWGVCGALVQFGC